MIFCDASIAGAIRTQAFTKRKVYVQADAFVAVRLGKNFLYSINPAFSAEVFRIPMRYRRIAGVPRYRDIVLFY